LPSAKCLIICNGHTRSVSGKEKLSFEPQIEAPNQIILPVFGMERKPNIYNQTHFECENRRVWAGLLQNEDCFHEGWTLC